MRKEVGYAIIAGVFLGLIVAFGFYRINTRISKNNPVQKSNPTPVPTGLKEFKVVLDKPGQNDVTTQSSITVAGLTKSKAWIAMSGESGDNFIRADKAGVFSQEVDLTPGVNQIKITAFDPSGNQSATGVLIVYSSSFVEKSASPISTTGSATGSSDINQKVAQDLAKVANQPKADIGTVTDVTDSTLEIKTKTGDIEQISVSASATSVVNITGTNNKPVKTTDIAIGDFIVAMGYIGENSVLSAQRILISDPVTEPKITISHAKVTSVTKKALNVIGSADGKEDIVQPDAKTRIATYKDGGQSTIKFGSISEDDIITYVEKTDTKGVTRVRSIFVIPQNLTD